MMHPMTGARATTYQRRRSLRTSAPHERYALVLRAFPAVRRPRSQPSFAVTLRNRNRAVRLLSTIDPPRGSDCSYGISWLLIDLVILNLFAEYWGKVFIDSFTTSLWAALVLQILLKLTLWVEHHIGTLCRALSSSKRVACLRFFLAWVVLFGSKFFIMEAIILFFGENLRFEGVLHGVVPLTIVLVTMVVAEEAVVRLYRKLG